MNKLIYPIILTFVLIGCSQDPKSKLYNEETVQQDMIEFSEDEKKLIMTYVIRESMGSIFSGDTSLIDLKSKTYGEMISSQLEFETNQRIKDSLDRVEEEKRRIILEQKQDSLRKLVEITVVDIYERKEYGDWGSLVPHIKINMKSVEGKKVNSLRFEINVFDKKGNELGSMSVKNNDSFKNSDNGTWTLNTYSDLYSVFKGSNVNDYTYGYKIKSMIYDGELIELE
tara:strand:+ start:5567 stop:6247 length:681 start_codon:yes stop_codon:yes gene_type:complete